MDVRAGQCKRLRAEELMFLNCGIGEDSDRPLNCKEIKPVNPKGNQSWIFTGRTDVETEALILWSPDVKSRLTGKELDVTKDWRQEEKGTTEDEMVGWHHRLNRHEFEQTLGNGEGQRSLGYCCPWGGKESDTTERLNNNNKAIMVKNLPARAGDMRHGFDPRVREILWRRGWTEEITKSMDRGTWRAIVHTVAQSQTWLKQLSTKLLWKT